jgi:class 3 adenylate cyclase
MPLPYVNYSFGRDLLAEPLRRAAVLEAVRTGTLVASEPLSLFNSRRHRLQSLPRLSSLRRQSHRGRRRCRHFPSRFHSPTLRSPASRTMSLRSSGSIRTSNRSLYVWMRDNATPSLWRPTRPTPPRLSASSHSLQFKFAQRTWRLDVCFFDEYTHVDHQVVVPIVFVAVAVGVAVVVAMVLCIRSASAHENGQRQLLSMVFPVHIASALISRLRVRDGRVTVDTGGGSISQYHEFVTLIFIDVCDFTTISSYLEPHMLVRFVDEFVCVVDKLLARYPRLLKIKTIGDAYFVAAGLGGGEEKSADGLPYHVLCLRDALDFCARVQREVQSRHRFFVQPKAEFRHTVRVAQRLVGTVALARLARGGALAEGVRHRLRPGNGRDGGARAHRRAHWRSGGGRVRPRAAGVRCVGRHVQCGGAHREHGRQRHDSVVVAGARAALPAQAERALSPAQTAARARAERHWRNGDVHVGARLGAERLTVSSTTRAQLRPTRNERTFPPI